MESCGMVCHMEPHTTTSLGEAATMRRLLSVQAAAQLMGMKPFEVIRLIDSGDLGTSIQVDYESVVDYLQHHPRR